MNTNRYGFNGKENDNEVGKGEGGQQDYGMRIYDPRVGRFLSVDPITKDYPELTPYQFASNMPIQFVDLDGLEAGPPPSQLYLMNKDLYDDLVAGKQTPRVVNSARAGAVILFAGALALDAAFTKGWATRTLLASQVAGLFEHNTAKSEEGIFLQSERFKDGVADLMVGYGGGKVLGTTVSVTAQAIKSLGRVTTASGEAFFWSGRTAGVGGAEKALEIAKKQGGTTLEGLIESRGIKMPEWNANDPVSVKAWQDISAEYAAGVSGKVRAVIGEELRPGNVWEGVELKALKENKNVTEIITIDPKTMKETSIFRR